MSSAQFDPCRQWLGIDAVELGDPRRVLGLLPSEADPLVVLRAADARLKLLRGIAAGPFDMARNALIKRVEESREAVLAQIAAAPTPPMPVGTTFTMPPPPATAGAAQPPQSPLVPLEPVFPAATSPGEEPFSHGGEDRVVVNLQKRTVYRKQSNTGVILLMLGSLVAATGGLAWYQKDNWGLAHMLSKLDIGTKEPAAAVGASDKPLVWPKPSEEAIAATALGSHPSDTNVSTGLEPGAANTSSPLDEPPLEVAGSEAIDPFLEQALTALQNQRFDDADQVLVRAGEEASGFPAHGRLAHWQALANCAKRFAEYRDRALAAEGADREYEIDGKRLAIVEIDDQKIVYRYAGRNKTLSRSRIPDKLLLAMLRGWLGARPANHLFLGAYYATKSEPDLEKARAAWRLAERGGADASELLPLLADPVLVKAAESAAGRDNQ